MKILNSKRILSIILSAVMILSMFPVTAFGAAMGTIMSLSISATINGSVVNTTYGPAFVPTPDAEEVFYAEIDADPALLKPANITVVPTFGQTIAGKNWDGSNFTFSLKSGTTTVGKGRFVIGKNGDLKKAYDDAFASITASAPITVPISVHKNDGASADTTNFIKSEIQAKINNRFIEVTDVKWRPATKDYLVVCKSIVLGLQLSNPNKSLPGDWDYNSGSAKVLWESDKTVQDLKDKINNIVDQIKNNAPGHLVIPYAEHNATTGRNNGRDWLKGQIEGLLNDSSIAVEVFYNHPDYYFTLSKNNSSGTKVTEASNLFPAANEGTTPGLMIYWGNNPTLAPLESAKNLLLAPPPVYLPYAQYSGVSPLEQRTNIGTLLNKKLTDASITDINVTVDTITPNAQGCSLDARLIHTDGTELSITLIGIYEANGPNPTSNVVLGTDPSIAAFAAAKAAVLKGVPYKIPFDKHLGSKGAEPLCTDYLKGLVSAALSAENITDYTVDRVTYTTDAYRVRLKYTDGTKKNVDLTAGLQGSGKQVIWLNDTTKSELEALIAGITYPIEIPFAEQSKNLGKDFLKDFLISTYNFDSSITVKIGYSDTSIVDGKSYKLTLEKKDATGSVVDASSNWLPAQKESTTPINPTTKVIWKTNPTLTPLVAAQTALLAPPQVIVPFAEHNVSDMSVIYANTETHLNKKLAEAQIADIKVKINNITYDPGTERHTFDAKLVHTDGTELPVTFKGYHEAEGPDAACLVVFGKDPSIAALAAANTAILNGVPYEIPFAIHLGTKGTEPLCTDYLKGLISDALIAGNITDYTVDTVQYNGTAAGYDVFLKYNTVPQATPITLSADFEGSGKQVLWLNDNTQAELKVLIDGITYPIEIPYPEYNTKLGKDYIAAQLRTYIIDPAITIVVGYNSTAIADGQSYRITLSKKDAAGNVVSEISPWLRAQYDTTTPLDPKTKVIWKANPTNALITAAKTKILEDPIEIPYDKHHDIVTGQALATLTLEANLQAIIKDIITQKNIKNITATVSNFLWLGSDGTFDLTLTHKDGSTSVFTLRADDELDKTSPPYDVIFLADPALKVFPNAVTAINNEVPYEIPFSVHLGKGKGAKAVIDELKNQLTDVIANASLTDIAVDSITFDSALKVYNVTLIYKGQSKSSPFILTAGNEKSGLQVIWLANPSASELKDAETALKAAKPYEIPFDKHLGNQGDKPLCLNFLKDELNKALTDAGITNSTVSDVLYSSPTYVAKLLHTDGTTRDVMLSAGFEGEQKDVLWMNDTAISDFQAAKSAVELGTYIIPYSVHQGDKGHEQPALEFLMDAINDVLTDAGITTFSVVKYDDISLPAPYSQYVVVLTSKNGTIFNGVADVVNLTAGLEGSGTFQVTWAHNPADDDIDAAKALIEANAFPIPFGEADPLAYLTTKVNELLQANYPEISATVTGDDTIGYTADLSSTATTKTAQATVNTSNLPNPALVALQEAKDAITALGGTFIMPLADQATKATRIAWVTNELSRLIPSGNGTTVEVTLNAGVYTIILRNGSDTLDISNDVTIKLQKSNDTSVASVVVEGVPANATSSTAYAVDLDASLISSTMSINITPSSSKAQVSAPQTTDGGYTWTFTVTAQDKTTADYQIIVTEANPQPIVYSVSVSKSATNPWEYDIVPSFTGNGDLSNKSMKVQISKTNSNGDVINYKEKLPASTSKITINATAVSISVWLVDIDFGSLDVDAIPMPTILAAYDEPVNP